MSAALEHLKWWLLKRRRRAVHAEDAWRYLSLSWRAPMREPEAEKVPIGILLPDKTFPVHGPRGQQVDAGGEGLTGPSQPNCSGAPPAGQIDIVAVAVISPD
jgi:hypothetical protein